MKCYVEVKKTVVEKIPLEEVISDCIRFFRLFGFYEKSCEYDLAFGPAVDETNNTIIEMEQITMKYGLYNEEEACSNEWYHDHKLFPAMIMFFKKNCFIKTE